MKKPVLSNMQRAAIWLAAMTVCTPQAQAHGSIPLENELALAVDCMLYLTRRDAHGMDRGRLLQYQVGPGQEFTVALPPGTLPARAAFAPAAHHVSDAFSSLQLFCQIAGDADMGPVYSAEFYAALDGSLPGVEAELSSMHSDNPHCTGLHELSYPLTSVTPSDATAFAIRLAAHDPFVTREQLQLGAPVEAYLIAYALDPAGARLEHTRLMRGPFPLQLLGIGQLSDATGASLASSGTELSDPGFPTVVLDDDSDSSLSERLSVQMTEDEPEHEHELAAVLMNDGSDSP